MSSLSSLGLSPSVVAKLIQAAITQDAEILRMKPTELSNATNLSLKESSEVIRLVSSRLSEPSFQATTLKEMLEREEEVDHIVTFCKSVDDLLGGGLPLGTITEVSGTPGIGKTQLCLQVCVSVQLPENCGGVNGEAIFIDTEGSFTVSRLTEMATWAEKHIDQISSGESGSFNVEKILKGIYYFRCNTYLELIAVVKHLQSFMKEHPRVRLVVIDSVAFHFRHDFTNMMTRTSILCSLTQDLIQQAMKHKLAVLVTNQMTMRIEEGGGSQLVAALGETWGHCPTLRLYMFWTGLIRAARLIKAPHIANSTVFFQITSGGIRDRKTSDQPQSSTASETKKRKYEDS